MNKNQFAQTVANAVYYFNGMNQCWLVYDTETGLFSYQSSLTPLYDTEIVVDENCSADSFYIDTDNDDYEDFLLALLDECYEDYWKDITYKIEYPEVE